MAGKLVLAIGRKPPFLTTWASPESCFRLHDMRTCLFRVNNPRQKLQFFCDLTLEVIHFHFQVIDVKMIQCERGLHKDVNTKRQGSSGAILEAGYHS